jgi:hypothetical protein
MPLTSSSSELEPSAGYAIASSGVLIINGVTLCVSKFEHERKVDKQQIDTTCSNGKHAYQPTIRGVEFSGEAFLDLATSPFTVIPDTLGFATVTWSANGTAVTFTSSKCVIESLKESAQVGSVITWTFSGVAGDDYAVL